MTENDGPAWVQPIFYPFMHTSNFGRGIALSSIVHCDSYSTAKMKEVPFVESIGVFNEEKGELTIFAVNRSLEEDIEFEIDLRDFNNADLMEHIVLEHEDLKAVNSGISPNNVAPHQNGRTKVTTGSAIVRLNKHSWNVIRFQII